MSESLAERDDQAPLGEYVTKALRAYVDKAKQNRKLAMANRMKNAYEKAWHGARTSPGLFVEAEKSTAWVPYATASTELGEVSVGVRLRRSEHRDSRLTLEVRVADEAGISVDDELANCVSDRNGVHDVQGIPDYNSPAYGETVAILAHIDSYFEAQTAQSEAKV